MGLIKNGPEPRIDQSAMVKKSQVGQWSVIESTTAFAVGNGTTVTARSNAFEVTKDGGMILKSPNCTRYKITVDDTGALTTAAVS